MFRPAVAKWRAVTRERSVAAVAAGATAVAALISTPSALCEPSSSSSSNAFDPEALERGAAALREINKSPNAKQVRELKRCGFFARRWGVSSRRALS